MCKAKLLYIILFFGDVMKIEEVGYLALLDAYKKILTPTKYDIAEMYFCLDLSLSEIAEIKLVTRQSVLDAIKTVKAELDELESKIGLVTLKQKITDLSKELPEGEREKLIKILEK